MDKHLEPCCCFDASLYTGVPDPSHIPNALNVPEILSGLDARNSSGREAEGEAYLEQWLQTAREKGDWRAELAFLSELLGQYRRTGNREKGISTVNASMELVRAHHLGQTVSGATVLLNAATTMDRFGLSEGAIPVFRHVSRIYAEHLDPTDYRFAGLYNNMAASFGTVGDLRSAEQYYYLAISVLEKCPGTENDIAVTLCNLAELYGSADPEDVRIERCLEQAWTALDTPGLAHDGYHAFTISKCAPVFDYFGFFLYAKTLRQRMEEIYAGA